jgi:Arc/MetJ family transcription regulator
MRTNIDIDDKLMDYVMASGEFKTKREAVEAGLQLIKRRHAYAAIRAARGTLFWDDSDEAWAKRRAERAAELAAEQNNQAAGDTQDTAELAVHETAVAYKVVNKLQPLPPAPTRQRKRAGKAVKS